MVLLMAVVTAAMVLLTVDTTAVVMAAIVLPAVMMAATPEDLGRGTMFGLCTRLLLAIYNRH